MRRELPEKLDTHLTGGNWTVAKLLRESKRSTRSAHSQFVQGMDRGRFV